MVQSLMFAAVEEQLRAAATAPLMSADELAREAVFDRDVLKSMLPGEQVLFLKDISVVDLERSIVAARCAPLCAGTAGTAHSAEHSLIPGMRILGALAEAHRVLLGLRAGRPSAPGTIQVDGATFRFLRPLNEHALVQVGAHLVEDETGWTMIGQWVQQGTICAVAALSGARRDET
jgi:hypothetical protein